MTTFAGYDFQPQIVPRTPHHPETQLSPKVHPNSAYTASWAPLPRHSIHRWTIEEQAILLVLERWYTSEKPVGQRLLSFRDMRRVFCAYFAETIRFQGENREITDNAIGAQLWEIKNEREYNVAWREVFLETDFLDPFDEWTATREELAATASLLGITLLRRQSEEKDLVLKEISSAAGAKRKRVHHSRPWTNEQEQPEIGKAVISYGLLTPGTPKRVKPGNPNHSPLARKGIKRSGSLPALQQNRQTTAQYGSAVRGLASLSVPKIFPPTSETSPHRKPTKRIKPIRNVADENDILFRFYDNSSQGINSPQAFVAGAFTAYGLHSTFPVVPNLLSEDFLLPAEPHLLRRHEATPFISVYESLVPALNRALRSTGTNVSIGIIDAHALNNDRNSEYPRAVWAPNVTQELRSRDLYHIGYDGDTEWLIWARIPGEAILSTISIDSLREYIKSHPDLEDLLHFKRIQKARSWYGYAPFLKAKAAKIDFGVGQTVGSFLAVCGIPQKYMQSTALSIAKMWKFRGLNDGKKNQDYVKGVYAGFAGHNSPGDSATDDSPAISDDDTTQCLEEDSDDDFAKRRRRIEIILSGHIGEMEGVPSAEPSTEEDDYDDIDC